MTATFEDLGLTEKTLPAIDQMGYTEPTPVQEQAIPLALAGRDVVAAAQTGTGKTAAFALPIIEQVGRAKHPGAPKALIVTPTRELAQQIDQAFSDLAQTEKRRILTVVGGVKYEKQINKLKNGVDILIATPGRLFDLMERKVVKLNDVQVLVLDETDRMVDMGFWPTVRKIVAACPKQRQTLFFSATIDRSIMDRVGYILNDPAFVEISHRGETADTVDQFIMPITPARKPELLQALLKEKGARRILIFTRTKSRADVCRRQLREAGYKAESIHADKSQGQRQQVLERFIKGKIDILVATDVLARGIDISQIQRVINYDLPESPEDYVHRIGRTGRAGESGFAISFVEPEEKSALREIERLIGSEIPMLTIESFDNSYAVDLLAKQFVAAPKNRSVSAFSRATRLGRGGRGGYGAMRRR